MQYIELNDVHLSMLGRHQLQNALTAACAALCLRDQGEVFHFISDFYDFRLKESWSKTNCGPSEFFAQILLILVLQTHSSF